MSHFSTIQTQFTAIEYLKKALNDLQCSWQEGDLEISDLEGKIEKVEIRIKAGGYGAGFRKKDGFYELVGDWWGAGEKSQEEFLQKLTVRYAYHAVKDQLGQEEFTFFEEENITNNTIHILVRRMI